MGDGIEPVLVIVNGKHEAPCAGTVADAEPVVRAIVKEGRKGRIEEGQFADLIVPSRDYFACAESEISGITSDLTIIGGKVVYAAGEFSQLDDTELPLPMPDWSPVRAYSGYGAWREKPDTTLNNAARNACGCGNSCNIHGHAHARAWSSEIPAADLQSFWGALGCACWI